MCRRGKGGVGITLAPLAFTNKNLPTEMNNEELIEVLESMPEDADIYEYDDFGNLRPINHIRYDAEDNIIIVE